MFWTYISSVIIFIINLKYSYIYTIFQCVYKFLFFFLNEEFCRQLQNMFFNFRMLSCRILISESQGMEGMFLKFLVNRGNNHKSKYSMKEPQKPWMEVRSPPPLTYPLASPRKTSLRTLNRVNHYLRSLVRMDIIETVGGEIWTVGDDPSCPRGVWWGPSEPILS